MRNITIFLILLVGLAQAQVTLSLNQLDFGDVLTTADRELAINVTNTTSVALEIDDVNVFNTDFTYSIPNATIDAGATEKIRVTFKPRHNLMYNTELIIVLSDGSEHRLDLIGNGKYEGTYYDATFNKSYQDLKDELKTILAAGYTNLGYTGARDKMYGEIDNDAGKVTCVYTGRVATSNNFMDYMEGPIVYDEESLSECQLNLVHKNLKGILNSSYDIDDCVIPSYCQADVNRKVIIESGENDIWTNARFLNGDLIIRDGGVLKIQCYVSIPSNGKIIVEKGGQLTLDGGIISNECNDQWQGIYVEGDPNLSQIPLSNQGYVHIINGGTIEHARNAVTLCGLDANGNTIFSKSGGVLIASTAIFKDNWRDISFTGYHFQPSASSFANPNVSSFTECDFITTNDYRSDHVGDIWPNVTMWGVVQVRFLGCTFHDQRDGIGSLDPRLDDYLNRRDGLFAMDASYKITDKLSFKPFEVGPASVTSNSVFKNMRYGIQSLDNPLTGNNYTA